MCELEKELEQWTVSRCESLGLRCLKITGPVGWPDRTIFGPACYGKVAFIEFKTSRGHVSRAQQYWLKLLAGCGHACTVARTKEEVERCLGGLVKHAI